MIGTIFSYQPALREQRQYGAYLYNFWDIKRETLQVVNVSSYSIVLESTDNATGTVTVAADMDGDYSNSFILIEGIDTPFRIANRSTTQGHITTLTVGDFCSALDGCGAFYDIGTDENPTHLYLNTTYNALLRSTMSFPPETHMQYDIGLLADLQSNRCGFFYSENNTQFDNTVDVRELVKDGFLQTSDMLRYIASIGYKVEVTGIINGLYDYYGWNLYDNPEQEAEGQGSMIKGQYTFQCIGVKVNSVSMVTTPVYFEDGHSFLDSCTINDDVVSRVHVQYAISGQPRSATYYLGLDGNLSSEDAGIVGKTDYASGATLTAAKAAAQEIFNKNTHSHSVVFRSDKEFHIGQPVKLMLSSGALDSAISKVTIKSDTDLKEYTCGALPASAAEQIKATSWTYGKRLPVNPKKGDLVML